MAQNSKNYLKLPCVKVIVVILNQKPEEKQIIQSNSKTAPLYKKTKSCELLFCAIYNLKNNKIEYEPDYDLRKYYGIYTSVLTIYRRILHWKE